MRALIVSDIHANLEAFQTVIDDVEGSGGFGQIWNLGDLVGYGPDPGGCIELLREYDHIGVAGNHDLAAVGRIGLEWFNTYAAAAARWTKTQLSDEHIDYLRALPLRVEVDDFTAVHGSPRDPVWEYVVSRDVATANFGHFDTLRCLVGHSHLPFICRLGDAGAEFFDFPADVAIGLGDIRCIVNPGSVGQPRDGLPTASYAVYDSDAGTITHHRTAYDIPATQRKMRERGLPGYLVDRLAVGR